MKVLRAVLLLAGLLAALPATAAHKNIAISDTLTANADQLKVKMGAQWLGIHKWRFGDYAVLSSKSKGTTTESKSNFWKTKSSTTSSNSFKFILGNKTTDSAFVHATQEMKEQSQHPLKVTESVGLGSEERMFESNTFTATITINHDTTSTWTLHMGGSSIPAQNGNTEVPLAYKMMLTQGERNIALKFVTSRPFGEAARSSSFFSKVGSSLSPPAMGYEFIEDGQSLGAVQFNSEGLGGAYTFFVWIRRDLDARTSLMLASAMTAVLEMQSAEGGPALPDED